MADLSHFTMAGFSVDMHDARTASQTTSPLVEHCDPSAISGADYVCLTKDKSGAELRIGVRKSPTGQFGVMTMNPAFSGAGRMAVEITKDVSPPDYLPYERTFTAHFAGEQTPLVFDLADPKQGKTLKDAAKITVDIAAFGFDPKIFPDEAAYMQSQGTGKIHFAANAFIPSGLFKETVGGAMQDDKPVAYADFTGKVLKAELRTNTQGNGQFWWALVQTYDDATLDVLMDPRQVITTPTPGAVITGRFWLSAHIVEDK